MQSENRPKDFSVVNNKEVGREVNKQEPKYSRCCIFSRAVLLALCQETKAAATDSDFRKSPADRSRDAASGIKRERKVIRQQFDVINKACTHL